MKLAKQSRSKSFESLTSRNIDSNRAQKLLDEGLNLSKLSQMNRAALRELGLDSAAIDSIHGHRPRIPPQTFQSVLYKSRWTCCICRTPDKEIILHHIDEWSKSRDHSEPNLVVLCLQCHGKAHSKHELSINLGREELISAKAAWESEVRGSDARVLAAHSGVKDHSYVWYYVNHQRLFAAARNAGFNPKKAPHYQAMKTLGLVDSRGNLSIGHMNNEPHAYAHGDCITQTRYVHEAVEYYVSNASIDNISDFLDKSSIAYRVREGDTIFLQGAFTFRNNTTRREGLGQERELCRRVGDIEFTATFDAWDCTSTSAWAVWLRGRQNAGAILKVRSVEERHEKVTFKCTALAVAFGLRNLKSRNYGHFG